MNPLTPYQQDAIGQAAHLQHDIQRFRRDWPTLNAIHDELPHFTWSQLERQLANLSATSTNAAMIHDLINATRKLTPFKPTEMVLREILCIASAVMDDSFASDVDFDSDAPPRFPDSEEGQMR